MASITSFQVIADAAEAIVDKQEVTVADLAKIVAHLSQYLNDLKIEHGGRNLLAELQSKLNK